jgi:hypothetical protein
MTTTKTEAAATQRVRAHLLESMRRELDSIKKNHSHCVNAIYLLKQDIKRLEEILIAEGVEA